MGIESLVKLIKENGIKIIKYEHNDPCMAEKEEKLILKLLDNELVEVSINADEARKSRKNFVKVREEREVGDYYRKFERWYLGFIGKCLVFTIEVAGGTVREYGEFYETYVLPLAKTIEAKKVTKKVGGGCGPDYEPAEEIEVQQIV